MTMDECCLINLPNYKKVPFLNKEHLQEYCMNNYLLSQYLPDEVNLSSITRDFFLNVSSYII